MNYRYRGKKNTLIPEEKRKPRYGLRKLSVGVVSCMIGCSIFFGNVVTASADVSDAKPPDTVVEEKQQDLDAGTEKADAAEENVSVTQGAEPEESAETEEAPELSEAEATENGASVPAPAGIAPMARAAEQNGDDTGAPQEVSVTGGEISLVRGVSQTVRFEYTDPSNKVKAAQLVDGGNKEETAFKSHVEINLKDEEGHKYVEITFNLKDNFSNGNFPTTADPGIWNKYIALYADQNKLDSPLNQVGSESNPSRVKITVKTQKTEYNPTLQTKVNVKDAANLTETEINSVKQAFETAKTGTDWENVVESIEATDGKNITVTYKDTTADTIPISTLVNEVPKFSGDDRPIFLIPDVPVVKEKVKEKITVTDDVGIDRVEKGHERNPEDTGYKPNQQDPLKGTTIVVEKSEDNKTAYVWYGIQDRIAQDEVDWILKQSENTKLHRSFLAVDGNGATTDSESIEIVLYQPAAETKTIGTNDSLTVSTQTILDQVKLGFIHYNGTDHDGKITKTIKSVKKDNTDVTADATGYTLQRDILADATYKVVVTVESDWGRPRMLRLISSLHSRR